MAGIAMIAVVVPGSSCSPSCAWARRPRKLGDEEGVVCRLSVQYREGRVELYLDGAFVRRSWG